MIANLQPYPEYKESGVPWLGQIPARWDVRRMKLLLREVDARSSTGKEQLLRVSQYTGVTQRKAIDGSDSPNTRASSLVGYKRVTPHDLVINIMLAWNGSMGVSRYDGIASPAYCVYRFKDGARPWYYHELLRLPLYKGRIKTASTGVVESRLRLYSDDLGRIEAIQPPTEDQDAIVRFIDYANGRLERAIRAKRKVIALLHEQKQAIIHRAVTRGLDPTVPLKPSSIPWVGDIPAHWRTNRLKALVTEAVAGPYGSSLTKAMYVQQVYRVYGQQQVIPDDFKTGDYYISPEKFSEMRRYQVYADDVLVSVMGTVGRVAVVPADAEPGIINPRLVRYRPDFTRVRPRFLQLAMQSSPSRVQLLEASKGTTMDGLNMAILGRLVVAVPPLSEQDSILASIQTGTSPLATAIARFEREISLLREYRTRLVADVVTGKLDVRPAVRQLPSEPIAPEPDTELVEETEDAVEIEVEA